MKIAFLGARSAFDYQEIGGTNSFVRRISDHLAHQTSYRDEIDLIMYGSPTSISLSPSLGIKLFYYQTFEEALGALSVCVGDYDHVIVVYLPLIDRWKFANFRLKNRRKTKFHIIHFSWPDSRLRRQLMFLDNCFFYDVVFTISPRLFKAAQDWRLNAKLVLPPVPDDYFIEPSDKPSNNKLQVTYIGRTEPAKGAQEIIELFSKLQGNSKLSTCIYGYHFPHHEPSVRMHKWLLSQHELVYRYFQYEKHTPQIENQIRVILQETDILLLPYKAISSTIDSPLLLLEGMAASCIVISKPFGDIPELYGIGKFLIEPNIWVEQVSYLIQEMNAIDNVRSQVFLQAKKLEFSTSQIAKLFRSALESITV